MPTASRCGKSGTTCRTWHRERTRTARLEADSQILPRDRMVASPALGSGPINPLLGHPHGNLLASLDRARLFNPGDEAAQPLRSLRELQRASLMVGHSGIFGNRSSGDAARRVLCIDLDGHAVLEEQ